VVRQPLHCQEPGGYQSRWLSGSGDDGTMRAKDDFILTLMILMLIFAKRTTLKIATFAIVVVPMIINFGEMVPMIQPPKLVAAMTNMVIIVAFIYFVIGSIINRLC
jgi:hypothetical protein